MNRKWENKLLHFYTSGNIKEDFIAARERKTVKLRRVIRICFYAHCAAALICIAAAVLLKAGAGIAAVAICEVLLAVAAFVATGGTELHKTLLFCGDLALAAGMFTTSAYSSNKMPFIFTAVVSVLMGLLGVGALVAGVAKDFIEDFPPLSIRREHYTLLPDLSGRADTEGSEDEEELPEPEPEPLPPPRTEMQQLSDKLREILNRPRPAAELVAELAAEPAAELAAENIAETNAEPSAVPGSEQSPEPSDKPSVKPSEKPSPETNAKSGSEPVEEPPTIPEQPETPLNAPANPAPAQNISSSAGAAATNDINAAANAPAAPVKENV